MLNREQRQAVEHTGSPLVVYAGPGTGKTLVLEHKFAYLVEQGVSPVDIKCITFTRAAAKELGTRINKTLNRTHDPCHFGTTFHAFGLQILRQSGSAKLGAHASIASPLEQDSFLCQALRHHDFRVVERELPLVKQVISRLKKGQTSTRREQHIETQAETILHTYNKTLRKHGMIDYDDIIQNALTFLTERPELFTRYKEGYILLDEAQDTTPSQANILYALNCPNITIVGDQNQSIYRFAGADPNFMKSFENKTNATAIHLKRNYRNPPTIIEAANRVIEFNENYIDTSDILAMCEPSHPKGDVFILHTPDEEREAVLIASSIQNYENFNFSILYRRNEHAKVIERTLRTRGIPYQINNTHSHDRKCIRDAVNLLNFISDTTNIEYFKAVVADQFGAGNKTAELMIAHHERTERLLPLIECGKRNVRSLSTAGHLMLKKLMSKIEIAAELPTQACLKYAFDEILSDKLFYYHKESPDLLYLGALLFRQEKELPEIVEYLKNIKQEPKVHLMTLHAAKGTQNEVIFIIGAEEGLIPDEYSFISREAIEEERRLFYVGITRAQKRIIICHSKKRHTGPFNLSQMPSRFLKEIPNAQFI